MIKTFIAYQLLNSKDFTKIGHQIENYAGNIENINIEGVDKKDIISINQSIKDDLIVLTVIYFAKKGKKNARKNR